MLFLIVRSKCLFICIFNLTATKGMASFSICISAADGEGILHLDVTGDEAGTMGVTPLGG